MCSAVVLPTLRDRVVASEMGFRAVQILSRGDGNRVIAMKNGQIVDYDITEALNMKKSFNQGFTTSPSRFPFKLHIKRAFPEEDKKRQRHFSLPFSALF